MKNELLSGITSDGILLDTPIKRSDAHRSGIWHRAVSIIVLNSHGEIIIEQRSAHKDLYPGYYDIVGGHIQFNQSPIEAAICEIKEELSLKADKKRLEALCKDDELIEHVVLPEKSIINLERKTVYIFQISLEDEDFLISKSNEWSKLTSTELQEKGAFGEVSHLEFWPFEKIYQAFRFQKDEKLASGTLSVFAHAGIREKIFTRCRDLRIKLRKKFAKAYPFLKFEGHLNAENDDRLFKLFNPQPDIKANNSLVLEIFEKGHHQLAGSYRMDQFRLHFAGDPYWGAKYKDPGDRYIENLIDAIAYWQPNNIQDYLKSKVQQAKDFVNELLELPLSNGSRFRDSLGNLLDIAVAREAVIEWLRHETRQLTSVNLAYPTKLIAHDCLKAGQLLLTNFIKENSTKGYNRLLDLLKLGIEASFADFNNHNFQKILKARNSRLKLASTIYQEINLSDLAIELGGDKFMQEFFDTYIKNSPAIKIAYLPGTTTQSIISLAIVQEILYQNKHAVITFIPKTGNPGNDLSYDDAWELFNTLSNTLLKKLRKYQKDKRFTILKKGPIIHGIDPNGLHELTAQELASSDIVFAEGQAYAEIRGWRKPAYIAFRINGRVAKAIHGESLLGKCGFVRLTPGIEHYQLIENQRIQKNDNSILISQTTSDYVRAILHENLSLITKEIFLGDREKTLLHVKQEADRLNKTFAQIIIGYADHPPDEKSINELKNRHFDVFAFGGGGGFSAVTLKALRQLNKSTVAGVPSTDDGGSTGMLQKALYKSRGFVFGIGDMASILQDSLDHMGKQAVLSYRFPEEPESLVQGVMKRINDEVITTTSGLGATRDFISFICDQLNLARIIDRRFQDSKKTKIPLRGSSIRNLNIIAAYELCNALGDSSKITLEQRISASIILEQALGLTQSLIALPVTYDECALFMEYESPVPQELLSTIPLNVFEEAFNRITSQQYIDKFPHNGKRKIVGVNGKGGSFPKPNKEYLRRMQEAELIIMGAGSLVSSQLSQLAVTGVADALLMAQDKRRILVLNHVRMDETREMSVKDHVILIERVAERTCSNAIRNHVTKGVRSIRISDIFTDIVIPRTVARELEEEMIKRKYKRIFPESNKLEFIDLQSSDAYENDQLFRNKYVDFVLKYPEIREKYGITDRELEILSFLEQPQELYNYRSEKGRYRGALFATDKDIKYLLKQGIQLRSIHEVDSIGKNSKVIKAEGIYKIEKFPGLIPQSLMGIIQIAFEKGVKSPSD
jgi:2-phospho-L-lactate transferase/gluconeogenesis factor (CofD/UPF0052 family)/8-oxo-dGTP pyrophosphatase MutT (NUDIX family)